MFKLSLSSFFVAAALASRTLAECTATFTEGAQYTVSLSANPQFSWVDNNTSGFFGVDLKTSPGTEWFLSETGFGGYVFSLASDLSSSDCLFASRNDKVPGSGKIFHSLGCLDGVGELDLDEDFVVTCETCDAAGAGGGSGCSIKSSVTTECANTAVNDLSAPAGADGTGQVRTDACSGSDFQKWDVTSVV
ncbi:hypothetical protein FB45DRAFT_1054473 [Roridomyces roridus]|uniref:Uncharacterized protein n=1 Tax=Roridomyces roridus TaxID=1738132 RepID=A0AAD7C973_9AGAR|nr:hypothetical protein FB45DRAFT_1054473 [Roridomyces roridus]